MSNEHAAEEDELQSQCVNPGEKVEMTREVSHCMQIGDLITLNYREIPHTPY